MTPRIILASASPARLRVLRWAGLRPEVMVSGVDEAEIDPLPVAQTTLVLARRKAAAVAARLGDDGPTLVIGCDSLLEFDGRAEGKPASAAAAVALWRRMRGGKGWLHTAHCLIDAETGTEVSAVDTALIRFGDPTDAEIDAYVATGEPLGVAGAFTLEGFGAAWIDSIDGNYGAITGLSVPVLRRLLHQLDIEIVDLWATAGRPENGPGDPGFPDRGAAGDGPSDRPPGEQEPPHPRPAVGDDFRRRVEAVVAGLRAGEVVSYGDVATEAGYPGAARAVGAVLAHPGPGSELPWWRVVTVGGRLVPGHETTHARRLRNEGIRIVSGRVGRPQERRRRAE